MKAGALLASLAVGGVFPNHPNPPPTSLELAASCIHACSSGEPGPETVATQIADAVRAMAESYLEGGRCPAAR